MYGTRHIVYSDLVKSMGVKIAIFKYTSNVEEKQIVLRPLFSGRVILLTSIKFP